MSDHLGIWAHIREIAEGHGDHTGQALAERESAMVRASGLLGVDVSSFQGMPGQWAATAGRIDFGSVKLTEHKPDGETYINPDAAADWAFLLEQRKFRIAYMFGHPGSSAAATSTAFLAELERLGLNDMDGVALDLEVNDGLSAAEVDAWALGVTHQLQVELGRLPLLYTFLSFAGEGNCRSLGHLPLWIADPSSAPGHPRIPAPWKSHAIHQYAINGAIDRDLANYPTGEAMSEALGKAAAKHPAVKHLTLGHQSLAALAAGHDPVATPAQILRLTAEHSPGAKFADDVASFVNDVFDGRLDAQADVPAGLTLWLPAKS